jgi:hypothetical protein
LDGAIAAVAPLLGCTDSTDRLVFVTNATTGVSAGLRSTKAVLKARHGDSKNANSERRPKILQLSTVYVHVGVATNYMALNEDFELLTVPIEYPISEKEILRRVTKAIDEVTSCNVDYKNSFNQTHYARNEEPVEI